MRIPKITLLLSAFDRPTALWASLGSLIAQTEREWECHVLWNGETMGGQILHRGTVDSMGDGRITLWKTSHPEHPAWDCYWAADSHLDSKNVRSEWIAFPSDDSYYTPDFLEKMLSRGEGLGADLVLCDLNYDGRGNGGRRMTLSQSPRVGSVDKTAFIVRRARWKGFPNKRTESAGPSDCDGQAIERLIGDGVKWAKVDEVLAVHN